VELRAALDAAGHATTRISLPDGNDINEPLAIAYMNGTFRSAFDSIGMHYPCNKPEPDIQKMGLKYWAAEDSSTVADWAGGGCWGR